jgi:hypothetical protein
MASGYLGLCDTFFEPWFDEKIVLLELGVHTGGSLLLWRDYFPRGTIVGIDISLPKEFKPTERVRLYEGNQADPAFLSRVAHDTAPDGFDIIIDDASHLGELTKTAFWHLFDNHLKPKGLYVIEDWGTGYWDDWPDGKSVDIECLSRPQTQTGLRFFLSKIAGKLQQKIRLRSHDYGMVGFIKQLVDEQGAYDATRKRWKDKPKRESKFESITIARSIAFVRKADHQLPREMAR